MRRTHLVDGAYRIVFNSDNQPTFHNRTNIRDRSIDNVHGDAGFIPGRTNGFGTATTNTNHHGVYRTPGPHHTSKMDSNYNSANQANDNRNINSRMRPPSGISS